MVMQRESPPDLIERIKRMEKRIADLEKVRRINNTSIDSGELVIRGGDIVVREVDGTKVLEILHGAVPALNMYPIGDGTEEYKLVIFGWESASQGAALQLGVEKVNGNQDGGKLLLMRDATYLVKQRDMQNEVFVALGAVSDYPEHFWLRGRFMDSVDVDGQDALVVGQLAVSGGAASATFTYAVPKETTMVPMVTMQCATVMEISVTASSTSSFTVDWSNDAPAKTINFWAFRI